MLQFFLVRSVLTYITESILQAEFSLVQQYSELCLSASWLFFYFCFDSNLQYYASFPFVFFLFVFFIKKGNYTSMDVYVWK